MRTFAADLKRTSALRRLPALRTARCAEARGHEGDVCAFELAADASPIAVEAVTGRAMMLAPGDVFLGTTGYRESTRWVVGGIPEGGLVPGNSYWVLAESGVVGDLVGDSPRAKSHLGQVTYLGIVNGEDGQALNIRQFAETPRAAATDQGAPVFLVVGTSAEVGKTTAGIAVLRALRLKGQPTAIALKATGTSSFTELASYLDFGAKRAFDCVDFGLPTTYPSGRDDIASTFERALDACLSIEAGAVIVECGGDMLGANVPIFLGCLKRRRPDAKVILVAADALGALGGQRMLQDLGLSPTLIAGPCTDTPTLQQRTEAVCGVPAINL
ncbi:MAG TPA: hypothetical protein VMU17_07550, partial [Elusimicrobiota bacterium]|nr:hypothetical protein [Elusimicrobiota bacterium]